jgi:hypothetical protein
LWESETATDAELAAKEVEFIRKFRSNDPSVGFNRWPKLGAPESVTPNTSFERTREG